MYVRNRQVIPVVGPDLVTVEENETQVPLVRWLSPKLARHLKIADPERFASLHEVACQHLLRGGERKKIYNGLRELLSDTPLTPPLALTQLAGIVDFDLFFTSTFDPLLALALEKMRPGFSRFRDVKAYDTNPQEAFPSRINGSLVYHLLGKLDTFPDFAVWEEDYMEYLCSLVAQSGDKRLEGLFRQLRTRHLLLLGAPFGDWVVRLFLRAARGKRLSDRRDHDTGEYLADRRANLGEPTVFFFNHLAKATRIVDGAPAAFVEQLFQRWSDRRNTSYTEQGFLECLSADMPRQAVFLSYAREDYAAALRLAAQLSRAGVPVWLDKQRLQAGGNYERSLEHAIREDCSFFISLISNTTEAAQRDVAQPRYFHRERAWAAGRFQDGFTFYLPVVVDDTVSGSRQEPACFAKTQATRLLGGEPTASFIDRLRDLVDQYRQSGRPRD